VTLSTFNTLSPFTLPPYTFLIHSDSPNGTDAGEALLDTLISSRTRINLLVRFFLNPESKGYLRGLEKELGENPNALRVELNRLEQGGLLLAEWQGHRKWFRVNQGYPLFRELNQIVLKRFGIDQLVETVLRRIGPVEAVYLTGALASGLDADTIDVRIVGSDVNTTELDRLVAKAETLIGRKIRYTLATVHEEPRTPNLRLL